MKVIIGLGNPGREYEHTRHNVGWWALDYLAEAWHCDSFRRDGEGTSTLATVSGERVKLMKPQTYMNLSGAVLRPYTRREGWSGAKHLLVIVDDVAIPLAKLRFRDSGSAGGHNGLKSVQQALGGSQDYARLRIGIGPDDPRRRGDLADYVLGKFGKAETASILEVMPKVQALVEDWIAERAMPTTA